MRLRHLYYFLEVARCRSLNKAAKELDITQPALTLALNSLESSLNFKLFDRSYRGVSLTPDGARVLEDARQVLDVVESWKHLGHPAAREPHAPPPARPAHPASKKSRPAA